MMPSVYRIACLPPQLKPESVPRLVVVTNVKGALGGGRLGGGGDEGGDEGGGYSLHTMESDVPSCRANSETGTLIPVGGVCNPTAVIASVAPVW